MTPRHLLAGVAALAITATLLLTAGVQTNAVGTLVPTSYATADIPPAYLSYYVHAALLCPGLPWPLLAAVGKVESDHGRDTGPSPAGALGPMQFRPATWARYGVDGDGDGRRNPVDPADAIVSAAGYLCSLGVTHDARDALVSYNCGNLTASCQAASAGYVAAVLSVAAQYATAAGDAASPAALIAVRVALAQIGTPYLWGGDGLGGFDCSGLVRYAYAAAGIALPRTAQDQYDAGPLLARNVAVAAGDLLFFGSDAAHVHHVGIAIDNGRMVDAPHTGALVRIDIVDLADPQLVGISRPAALTVRR